jgi:hypothetical protein
MKQGLRGNRTKIKETLLLKFKNLPKKKKANKGKKPQVFWKLLQL